MTEYFRELTAQISDKSCDPAKYLPQVLDEIKKDISGEFIKVFYYEFQDMMVHACKAAKNKHEELMVEICIECFKRKKHKYYHPPKAIFREKQVVKWKGHEAAIEEITRILEEPIRWEGKKTSEKKVSYSDFGRNLSDTVQEMIKACNRDKILKKVVPSFIHLLTSCLESGSDMHIVIAIAIVEASEMTWEGCEQLIPGVLEKYIKWLRRDDIDFEGNKDHRILARVVTGYGMLEKTGKSSASQLKILMEYCLEHELEGDGPLSVHGDILRNIIYSFVWRNSKKLQIYRDLMPYVVKLLSCDVKDLERTAGRAIDSVFENGELLAPYGDDIAEAFLDDKCEDTHVASALKSIFHHKPEVVLSRIDRIAEKMEDMGSNDKTSLYLLLDEVGKKNSEVLVPHIDLMFEDLSNTSLATMCFMTIANISIDHADKMVKHLDRCRQAWEQNPYTISSACKTIASIGRLNKKEASKCLKIMFDKLKFIDPMYNNVILLEAMRIGKAHKECLEVYRTDIEKLKTCQLMGVPAMVQYMLDFLDDRSLQGLSEEVADQREDIDNLDSRVTNTENDVIRMDETVAQQGDDIQNVKNEVNEQGERLDELKEVVDETVEKVEEIDHKTITNAPKWSRDVSKLLNPEHDHDWRFLAVRLGYSGEDIRNWALSPDPTMAILAEWYTTHKSSDATYAILNALEDMGRTDAAEIITQSLEEAELLVPQAPPDDSEKPPTVFLSYQWDHQPEVKAIKKHLEMAGFPCWMDIGQMGGGDQLFAKISQGMRSSKVVLCMVTEKYSNSENCNKEVNLANLLNKPIIPILIDHTQWPPQGAMSMLFAQLLYIQFFNDKEYVRGEKFWDDAKFSELLGQVSYHATPDESMVSDEYRDWIPQVEDAPATVKKVSDEAKSSPAQESQAMESTEPPTVFISYQWGKQPEIKRLFSRLTGLGYHCWLDINQMGGGDPLYSKIDKGVRNAKVVLSCVTPKYALSANCRREVSLSDALRKPIIPLLLEDMTWPPEGPMSMTFTQLLYIDFTKESTQANFDDDTFDELIEKITEHAQPTLEIVSPVEQKDKEVTNQQQLQPTAQLERAVDVTETQYPSSGDDDETEIIAVNDTAVSEEENTGHPTPEVDAISEGQVARDIAATSEVDAISEGQVARDLKATSEVHAVPEVQTTPKSDPTLQENETPEIGAIAETPTTPHSQVIPEVQVDPLKNSVPEWQSRPISNVPAMEPEDKQPSRTRSAGRKKKSSTCLIL